MLAWHLFYKLSSQSISLVLYALLIVGKYGQLFSRTAPVDVPREALGSIPSTIDMPREALDLIFGTIDVPREALGSISGTRRNRLAESRSKG